MPVVGSGADFDSTKVRILDIAEHLFARQGYEGTPIRSIALEAQVNIAAVNYHFGSKANLFEAVFARRVVPMNKDRLRRLDNIIAAAGTFTLANVVESFVRPPFSIGDAKSPEGQLIQMKFLSRAFSMPDEALFLNSYYRDVRRRYIAALQQVLPDLGINDVLWRYNLMVGSLIYALAGPERMLRRPDEEESNAVSAGEMDIEVMIGHVTDFCVAGFNAQTKSADTLVGA